MTLRIAAIAAALLVTAAPAFAQGLASANGPYSPSAYAGYVAPRTDLGSPVTPRGTAPAYRYAGQHAGGPANDLARR